MIYKGQNVLNLLDLKVTPSKSTEIDIDVKKYNFHTKYKSNQTRANIKKIGLSKKF